MLYRLLADLVVVVHLAFIVFVAAGGLLAWRWPWLLRLHVPSVLWAAATITVGVPCPLTGLERFLHDLAGEPTYAGGFVDRYVEGVVYPESLTPLLRALVALAIAVGWAGLLRRRRETGQLGEENRMSSARRYV